MKEYALQLAASAQGSSAKRNILREYLQAYTLRLLHERGFFRSAAFVGGTALRFLYGLPRFSEDLDFCMERTPTDPLSKTASHLKRELTAAGYDISLACREDRTVQYVTVRFAGLLYEAGLAPLKDQKFSIKIEIDVRPPQGAGMETQIVNKYFPIAFLAYDLPSLFAGKLTALLVRRYTKGRDFFDLGWYLSRWPALVPNMPLLESGLKQASWKGEIPAVSSWRHFLRETVRKADWRQIEKDVAPFLENPRDQAIFTQENILGLFKE